MEPQLVEIIEDKFTIPAFRCDTISITREGVGCSTAQAEMVKEADVDENGTLIEFKSRGTVIKSMLVTRISSEEGDDGQGLQDSDSEEGQQENEESQEATSEEVTTGPPNFDLSDAEPRGPAFVDLGPFNQPKFPEGIETREDCGDDCGCEDDQPEDSELGFIEGGFYDGPLGEDQE